MKKLLVVLCAALLTSFVLTGLAQAADKFAYINLGRAFNEYSKTKEYDKTLTEKENNYTVERDKRIKDLNSLRDKFSLLSDKEKDAKKGELENKAKAVKDFITQKETDLRKEQEERMKEILKDIETTVKSYAEKEGYTMVFNDRVLVYQDKDLDITDKIIALLNKKK
ncbi:MAG: OmpH family outer membrane protein [Candidatus Omnitrophica bacterium]|nr:OmpH family outer membrane protein [Candidatus Omnitrophota bacterium]